MSIPPSTDPATSSAIITATNITDGATYELNFHDEIPKIVKEQVRIEVNDYFRRMKGTASFDQHLRRLLEKTLKKEVMLESNASYMVIDPPATSSGGDDSAGHKTVAGNDKPLSYADICRHVQDWAEVEVDEYFVRIVKAEVKDCISKLKKGSNKFSGKSEDYSSSGFEGRDASVPAMTTKKDDKKMSHDEELLKIAEEKVRIEVKVYFEEMMQTTLFAGQDFRMLLKKEVETCFSRYSWNFL